MNYYYLYRHFTRAGTTPNELQSQGIRQSSQGMSEKLTCTCSMEMRKQNDNNHENLQSVMIGSEIFSGTTNDQNRTMCEYDSENRITPQC